MDLFPLYILLDTTGGDLRVMEAANKWIWELNSPISPGSRAKIISIHLDWDFMNHEKLFFVHKKTDESGKLEFESVYGEEEEAINQAGEEGFATALVAKRYGHIVLYLQDK